MRTCPDCLSLYKASKTGKKARQNRGAWGHGLWPAEIYHDAKTVKCERHHTQALSDGAARRAGLGKATPPWADRRAIKAIYADCMARTQATGVPHEVDHIVPLKGEMVSGLHVHWNLRVITATANREKSNRH